MRENGKGKEGQQTGGALMERLRGVRKRKKGWRIGNCIDPVPCSVVAYKMKLVEAKQTGGSRN